MVQGVDDVMVEACSHEEMRRLDSFCYCMYVILVVTDEMVDVKKFSIGLDLLIRMSVDILEIRSIFLRFKVCCRLNYGISSLAWIVIIPLHMEIKEMVGFVRMIRHEG